MKLFDVIAAGLLVSNTSLEPQISWDTKLASILPDWGLMDPVASEETTILDAMSHRTGMPRHDFIYRRNDTVRSIVCPLLYHLTLIILAPRLKECVTYAPLQGFAIRFNIAIACIWFYLPSLQSS